MLYQHVITFVETECFQGKSVHYQDAQPLKSRHATAADFLFEKCKRKEITEEDR